MKQQNLSQELTCNYVNEEFYMNYKKELIQNIDKIHTTDLGIERIKRNLNLDNNHVVKYCMELIEDETSNVTKKGKNYYVTINNAEITVNSSSFTIITAHLKKK
jgi:predicted transcriptional regulator